MLIQGEYISITGRFLTIHRRRRKKLTTRSLTTDMTPAILDDIHHGQVQHILRNIGEWAFNAFTFDVAAGGRSLTVMCVHLFHWYGLLDYFQLEAVNIWKLFTTIEDGYHATNPYHNSIHATDVTQAMHCFLQEEKIRKHLTPVEVMASLIAAVTHDLDHPGVNQPFLVSTSNYLSVLYENSSVLENHHCKMAISCLFHSHIADKLRHVMPELAEKVKSLILATDITRQHEFLMNFQTRAIQDSIDMEKMEDRHLVLQIALKCADISNPCRPWEVSRKWSQRVCEEFFKQGDYEIELGLPMTSLCDRAQSSVPKIQSGFFKFVVIPLFDEWHLFHNSKLTKQMMKNLEINQRKWEGLLQRELANEIHHRKKKKGIVAPEPSADNTAAVEEPAVSVDEEAISIAVVPPISETVLLSPVIPDTAVVLQRRHSVPTSFEISSDSSPLHTASRRGSFPIVEDRQRLCHGEGRKGRFPIVKLVRDPVPVPEERTKIDILIEDMQQESFDDSDSEQSVNAHNLMANYSITSITTAKDNTRLASVLKRYTKAYPIHKPLKRRMSFPPSSMFVRSLFSSKTERVTAETNSCTTKSVEYAIKIQCGDPTPVDILNDDCGESKLVHESSVEEGSETPVKKSIFEHKENLDPIEKKDVVKALLATFNVDVSTCRRGSAPVFRDGFGLAAKEFEKLTVRRSSVPTEYIKLQGRSTPEKDEDVIDSSPDMKKLVRRSSEGPDILIPKVVIDIPRRGSLPLTIVLSSCKETAEENKDKEETEEKEEKEEKEGDTA